MKKIRLEGKPLENDLFKAQKRICLSQIAVLIKMLEFLSNGLQIDDTLK